MLTGTRQLIAQLELIPIVLAIWRWTHLFSTAGRRALIFVDNEAARHALIRGYSPACASRRLVEEFWECAANTHLAPWFERVPSSGNPADGPSRLCFSELVSLPMSPRQIPPPDFERRLLQTLDEGIGRLGSLPPPGEESSHSPFELRSGRLSKKIT